MHKKQILHLALLACSYSSLMSNTLFLGDLTTPDGNNNGFSFNLLHKLGKDHAQEIVYVASASADLINADASIKKYALSAASSSGTQCVPMALERATINGVTDQANPLYGAQLSSLNMATGCPVVMTSADTAKLYVITNSPLSSTCTILTNNGVIDANQEQGSFITIADSGNQNTTEGVGNLIFAAVKPNGGHFGGLHGGIALFRKTNEGLVQQKAVKGNDNVLSVSIDINNPAFYITNPLDSLQSNKINLHWSHKLGRLFVGIQPRNNTNADDGSLCIGVGYIEDDGINATLTLHPITSALPLGETKIVGAIGDNLTAYAYKQAVMLTSTGLTYLIMIGDSLDPENNNDLQKWCYALPLVDESADPAKSQTWATSLTHATLAKKGSSPTTFYVSNGNDVSIVTKRGFQTPATTADDLYDRTDDQALVGGSNITIANSLGKGIITDIEVHNDTVFVLLSGASNFDNTVNIPSGVFYSQAIFDQDGAIANWTTWQRVTCAENTTIGAVTDFAYMPLQGKIFQLQAGDGIHMQSITLNKWSNGDKDGLLGGTITDNTVGLSALLSTEFPQEDGGVFGLFDFAPSFATHFFAQAPDNSMMIATGHKKVGFILTSMNDILTRGNFKDHSVNLTDGKIIPADILPNTHVALFVSGGTIDKLERITCATIIYENQNDSGYILIGGTNGVAALRQQINHHGIANPLDSGFAGIDQEVVFDIIGDFTHVKKLWTNVIGNDQWLFILTLNGLYRIAATELFKAKPTIVTLATLETNNLGLTQYDFFTDVITSNKLCLLGTNKGLFRNGDETNISTVTDAQSCNWKSLHIPAAYQNIVQLLPLLTSPRPYEFATHATGQVYALAHSNSSDTSAIHCFSISDISTAAIDNNTCTPVYKETVQGTYAPFMSLGSLRNTLATNGALTLTTSIAQPNYGARIFIAPLSGAPMIRTFEHYPFSEIQLSPSNTTDTIRGIVYNSALGSWIAYGNFGIRVCE